MDGLRVQPDQISKYLYHHIEDDTMAAILPLGMSVNDQGYTWRIASDQRKSTLHAIYTLVDDQTAIYRELRKN